MTPKFTRCALLLASMALNGCVTSAAVGCTRDPLSGAIHCSGDYVPVAPPPTVQPSPVERG